MSKIINEDEFDKIITNLRAEGISPVPFITPDFNFSAKFYAGWLRWLFDNIKAIEIVINQLLKREIATTNSDSIQLTQDGNWTNEFVITLKALLKISEHIKTKKLIDYKGVEKTFTLLNAIKVFTDGAYTPDYESIIDFLNNEVNIIQGEIKKINNEIININNEIININKEINNIINIINNFPSGSSIVAKVMLLGDGKQYGYGDVMVLPSTVSTYKSYEIEYAVGNAQYTSVVSRDILTRKDICPTISGIQFDGATQAANSVFYHLDGVNLRVGITEQKQSGAQSVNLNNNNILNNGDVTKSMISIQAIYGIKEVNF